MARAPVGMCGAAVKHEKKNIGVPAVNIFHLSVQSMTMAHALKVHRHRHTR